MVITLIIWLVAGIAAWGYGGLCTGTLCTNGPCSSWPPERLVVRLYSGLLVLICLLTAVALFTGIRWWIGFIAVVPGTLWAIREYHQRSLRSSAFFAEAVALKPFLAILGCTALFVSTREVNFYDTGLYHQQVVNWLSEYGLVTGLALVHIRFGWTSSWFAGAAALNHGALAGREVPIVGGVPFALVVVPSLVAALLIGQGRLAATFRTATWVIFSGMLATVATVWSVEASLSPDFMVWLLPSTIALLATDTLSAPADRAGRSLVVSLLACTVKLTALPLVGYSCMLWGWHFVCHSGFRRRLLRYAAVAGFAALVLLAANSKASGCPLFPSPVGCSSGNSSVGPSVAAQAVRDIRQFAQSGNRYVTPLLLTAIFASLVALRFQPMNEFVRHGVAVSCAGILFVLATAPNPRFGMGYFLLPVALALAALLDRVRSERAENLVQKPNLVLGFIVLVVAATCAASIYQVRDTTDAILPRRMASANGEAIHVFNRRLNLRTTLLLSERRVGNMVVLQPESSDQCWDAPLPCTPGLTLGDLELRDPRRGFRGGFWGHNAP